MPFLAAALLATLASTTPAADDAPNRYRITLGDDLRTARVEATVRLRGGSLRMADWGFPAALELGWAGFVEGLEVREEGVTEYVANRTLARTGAISREEWLQKVGFHLGRFWGSRFLARPPGPSLEEAGKAKMQHWRLVYGGGASLGLMLDVELRAATGGRRSLDDVLRALERRHAAGGRPFTREDLGAALSEAAGRDLSGYLAAHAAGTDWPPVEETLRKAGPMVVSFADEFYVRPDPAAAPAARALRRGLVGW